jgi:hypothetical protein
MVDQAEKVFARAGIETIRNFADVIAWADVYAVDNSSTLFEAKALGLDVVYLDAPWYTPFPGSLRFDLFTELGPHLKDGDLAEAAMHANDNRVSYDGSRMVAEIFGDVDGATTRAVKAVQNDILGTEGSTPSPAAGTNPTQPSLFGQP